MKRRNRVTRSPRSMTRLREHGDLVAHHQQLDVLRVHCPGFRPIIPGNTVGRLAPIGADQVLNQRSRGSGQRPVQAEQGRHMPARRRGADGLLVAACRDTLGG